MAEAEERGPLLTDDIRELLGLITEGDIAEVHIKRGDVEVHIKRAIGQPQMLNMAAAAAPQPAMPPPVSPAQTPTATPGADTEEAPATSGVTVLAPMVGTFYAAPSPKDLPYVHVGDEVQPGDVLGIIEAMKIMNEIECEIPGRVLEILAESGQPVEYGQPLMIIEPLAPGP